ncbi:Rv3235 family protein [Rhodococcoides corynebacterioides]|uniref:Uncharacterized protein n=1 Tax=Rhodococcoides corynebacterioides TaxID=53972 RepID=A0ABS7P0H1_9NOCA|nr:Rv3235 family protein [Rhodococcus corynebacterioides]MBY6365913.1 hypothetical protein [Rhodococcus corynebacterioides]MBY6408556.1 hypothetical protein [Rhodococcus corynebacterioides]
MPHTEVRLDRLPASEPPFEGTAPATSTAPVAPHASVGRLSARRPGPHTGRSPERLGPPRTAVRPDPATIAARAAADRLLRGVFEVIDRRRAPSSLRRAVSPAVLGMVAALATTDVPGRAAGVAVIRTVHVRPAAAGRMEVFGSYSRGERRFAVAAQLTLGRTAGSSWTVTSLRLS